MISVEGDGWRRIGRSDNRRRCRPAADRL